jgi:hypothetical protein
MEIGKPLREIRVKPETLPEVKPEQIPVEPNPQKIPAGVP